MTRAAHDEIRRLIRLRQGADLQLMLLAERERSPLSAADAGKRQELEQRREQLLDRIAWFEGILREHDNTTQ
jgi:hypothetical protein